MPGPPQGPFATPAFRPFIPKQVGFWIFLAFVVIFRFSDAVYLASIQQMVGSTSLLSEDVEMISNASFIGMTMIFPILFRLKFRYTTQGILTFVTLFLTVNSLVMTHVTFVPLLVVAGFVSGALRIWGMFECMSSIMQGITPQRDFAVFFPVIYLMVLGFIQITGFVDTYITYYFSWQMMHYVDIALLLTVCLVARTLMHPFRYGPPMPLYGIDWLGVVIWSLVLGLVTFVFTYGEYLDWMDSFYIRLALAAALVLLGANLGRMLHIRHPYICYRTFRYPNVWSMLLLFFVMNMMMETQPVLQGCLTSSILHLDELHTASLCIPTLFGVVLGAYFSFKALTSLHWTYKELTFAGFLFLTYYLATLYFLVDASTPVERLYLPSFFRGFGNVTIYVAVTVYAQRVIPFQHFFQGLCILGFVRTGVGGPISEALYGHWFKQLMIVHGDLLGSQYSPVALSQYAQADSFSLLHQQTALCVLRQLFGISALLGVAALLMILASSFTGKLRYLVPTDWQVYRRLLKSNTRLQKKST